MFGLKVKKGILPELLIKGGTDSFCYFSAKTCCGPLLETTQRDGSNDGQNTGFKPIIPCTPSYRPGRVAQSVGHLTRKSGVLGSIPGLATYFRFSFRFFKKGSCQLLAKVCARSTG